MQLSVLNRISVIIPSLNPDEKLQKTVDSLLAVGFTDIICVNDGSREDCLAFFPQQSEQITRLTHAVNRGKGAALKTAFTYIQNNRPDSLGAVTVDGDGQHAASDVLHCAEVMIAQKENIILGCRDFSQPQVPKKSRYGNRITSTVFKILCGLKISDTQTGLRAIPAKYYADMLAVSGDRFEYETNMLLEMKARKIPFSEVKIETVYIEDNRTSHFRPFKDSYRIYSLILKFTFGQFAKFAICSLLSFAVDYALVWAFLTGATVLFSVNFAEKNAAVAMVTGCCCILARAFSSILNFLLNRRMVFSANVPLKKSLARYYCLVVPIAIISSAATALIELIPIFNTAFLIMLLKLVIDCALFIASYTLQKKWVFFKPTK